jgi:hypothetical protein
MQGRAISGIVGITFAIYKDQYEGAPLWLETQNVQADAKGNYTVQLGATKPEGLPLDLFSSGDALWLGVSINGGLEQPRVLSQKANPESRVNAWQRITDAADTALIPRSVFSLPQDEGSSGVRR